MISEIRNIKSGKKELRQFGFTMGIILAVLGVLLLVRGKDNYPYLFMASGVLIFLGLVWPAGLKPLQKAWMSLAVVMGWVMTRLILTVLFYLVISPIGLLAKLFNKDFLSLKLEPEAKSYWIPIDPKSEQETKAACQRQF